MPINEPTAAARAAAKLNTARSSLIIEQPFYATLLLRLPLEPNEAAETLETDGGSIEYNPAYINQLSIAEVKADLCHEILHLCHLHHLRAIGKDLNDWNEATDHAINHILLEGGFTLHPSSLLDPAFKDMSSEAIYQQLRGGDQQQDGAPPAPTPQQDDDGDDEQEQPGEGEGDGEGEGEGEGDGDGEGEGEGDGEGDGSGQGQGTPDPGRMGAVKPPQNLTPEEIKEKEGEIKTALAQAAQAAKNQGKLPADLARAIEEILYPPTDWRVLLREFLQASSTSDFSFMKRNVRFAGTGLIMPGLQSQDELTEGFFVLDTSISQGQRELDICAAAMASIFDEFNTRITVLYCDAQLYVEASQTFEPGEPIELKPVGGGGTDFRPPFDWLIQENIDPDWLIYFTDLACYDYPQPPAFPVLWACTDEDYARYYDEPPFGEVITVKL